MLYYLGRLLISFVMLLGGVLSNCSTLLVIGILYSYFICFDLIRVAKGQNGKNIIGIILGLFFVFIALFLMKNLTNVVLSIPSIFGLCFIFVAFLLEIVFYKISYLNLVMYFIAITTVLLSKFNSFRYIDMVSFSVINLVVIVKGLNGVKYFTNKFILSREVGDDLDAGITRSRDCEEKVK